MQTDIDYDDKGPQRVFEGRAYEARVTFLVPIDASLEEIEDYISFEWGGGSIENVNPLVDTAGIRRVDIVDLKPLGYSRYTDWQAAAEDDRRCGRGFAVRDGQPLPAPPTETIAERENEG